MDRELPDATIRRDRAALAAKITLPILALGVGLSLFPGWMRPTLNRSRIRLATVTTGPLDAVVTATGTVVPAVERVLSSPVDARLLRVLKRPGDAVHVGDPVAELDLSDARLAFDAVVTGGRLSENAQARARLAQATTLADLDGRIERQALDRQMLAEKADSSQRLFADGLVSQQALREAQLAVRQADLLLAQLRHDRDTAVTTADLQRQELSLQREALARQADQARRLLELGTARSDRTGVVTWALSQEGSLVRRGEVIARIADLNAFRVDATIADVHAARIRPGAPVTVALTSGTAPRTIDGTILDVQPTVDAGTVRFRVTLAEPAHARLRANLRVDVLVITDRRARTVKVAQAAFPEIDGQTYAFVVHDGRAYRTRVRLGLRSFDEVEVAGLGDGDQVVVSDMRDYAHLQEIAIR